MNETPQTTSPLPAFALVLALLAVLSAGLCWQQLKHAHRRVIAHLGDLQTEVKQNEFQIQEVNLQLGNMQTSLQRQQVDIADMQNAVSRVNPFDVEYRLLMEAEFLVRQAGLTMNYNHDMTMTVALLQAADKRVQAANDPSATKVRQAIAAVIAALQAAPTLDLEGLLAQLNAQREEVEKLTLFIPPKIEPQPIVKSHLDTSGWRHALKLSWQTLAKLVIVRRREEPIVPLITPDQEIYLKQNLQLLLQKAEWAAMHGQAGLYQTSLQQAVTWIKRYFLGDNPTTDAVLESLAELQKINVKPNLPSLDPTLGALRQALAQRSVKTPTPVHNNAKLSSMVPLPSKQEVDDL